MLTKTILISPLTSSALAGVLNPITSPILTAAPPISVRKKGHDGGPSNQNYLGIIAADSSPP